MNYIDINEKKTLRELIQNIEKAAQEIENTCRRGVKGGNLYRVRTIYSATCDLKILVDRFFNEKIERLDSRLDVDGLLEFRHGECQCDEYKSCFCKCDGWGGCECVCDGDGECECECRCN